jgi:hypothetical protein
MARPVKIDGYKPVTTVGDAAAEMLAALQTDTHTWRPDQGDAAAIAGKVESVSVTLMNYGPVPIIDVNDGSTVWRVFVLGTVAQHEVGMRELSDGRVVTNVRRGDRIGFRDLGLVASKKFPDHPYRLIRVIHEPAGSGGVSVAPMVDADNVEIPF